MDQGAIDEAFRLIRELGKSDSKALDLIRSLSKRIEALEDEVGHMKQTEDDLMKVVTKLHQRVEELERNAP